MAINGLGFAEDPADLNSEITPAAPQLDPLGSVAPPEAGLTLPGDKAPAEEESLIDPNSNPLGAIGAVLQNVSRGAKGQRLYTDELRDRRMMQEERELKRLSIGVDAMSKGLELMENTPAGQRSEIAQQYGQLFEKILPGFTNTLMAGARKPRDLQATMEVMGEHGPLLVQLGGDLDSALKLSQDTALIKRLDQQADQRNTPEITMAFKRAEEILKSSAQGSQILQGAAEDGWTLSDLQDPQIQKALGLTKSHVNTIMRNKDVQNNLIPFGFTPDDLLQRVQQVKGEERAKLEERSALSGIPVSELLKKAPAAEINIGGEDKFAENIGKLDAESRAEMIKAGESAMAQEQDLRQMAKLLSSGETQTGTLQPAITGLQGLAQDLGIDMEAAGKAAGIDVGKLSTKQEFDRLSKRVIIEGFEKFKGNLNQKEVDLAVGAFANLGRDEQANKMAIASLMASQKLARQRAVDAVSATTAAEFRALQRERLEGDSAQFERMLEEAKLSMEPGSGEAEALPDGLPEGATPVGMTKDGRRMFKLPDGQVVVEE